MKAIAPVQRGLSLLLLVLGAAWVWHCLRRGESGAALWALLLPVVQAPVLGLEIAWAAWIARRPSARRPLGQPDGVPQPYPPIGHWLAAWLQEVRWSALVFLWRQPWREAAEPDHLPGDAAGRQGVLLVHGFVCNRAFWNGWMPRLREAGIPHVAVTVGPPFADIAQQAQALDAAWVRLSQATGRPPLLVGHSMGGLLIRSWLAGKPDEMALAHEVITIGSPHHGTVLAQMAHSEAAQQMRMMSDFLRELSLKESSERRQRCTCYWSVCDNIVFPANTATLPGASNRHLPGRPHVGLASDPEILAEVIARVTRSGSSSSAEASPAAVPANGQRDPLISR